jgi:hypothetical protein
MKRSFLGLEQKGHNLDEEDGNLNVEGELVDDIKVVAPIELEPTMNINQLLEYYTLIQSQLLEVECKLSKLLKMQLEVNKDLMCHKTQLDDKQYHLWVAKNSLSRLLLRLQDLKTNIKNRKPSGILSRMAI